MLTVAILAALAALLALLIWCREPPVPRESPPPPPRDPVAEEVARWMHQWERGRA
jgi:hypothetical protein